MGSLGFGLRFGLRRLRRVSFGDLIADDFVENLTVIGDRIADFVEVTGLDRSRVGHRNVTGNVGIDAG